MNDLETLARKIAEAAHPNAQPAWYEQTVERILPLLRELPAAGVRVKGLVWSKASSTGGEEAGNYSVFRSPIDTSAWMAFREEPGKGETVYVGSTLEAAKAACEADHAANVLALLEPAEAALGVRREVLERLVNTGDLVECYYDEGRLSAAPMTPLRSALAAARAELARVPANDSEVRG